MVVICILNPRAPWVSGFRQAGPEGIIRNREHFWRFSEYNMPVISRFLGIVIAMYWDDHVPAHFHAKYGEYEVIVHIATGVVEGRFPKRALRHVMEW